MTVTTTAPRPHRVRPTTDRSRPLGENELACRSCGRGVTDPDPKLGDIVSVWPHRALASMRHGAPMQSINVRVTRCDECESRLARARALVEALSLGDIPGPGDVLADKIDAALAGLELLGIKGDKTAMLTRNVPDLAKLIEALAPIGGLASWAYGLRENMLPTDTVAPTRWAHVDADLINSAWHAYGALIRYSLESPTACPPPTENGAVRGCLLCGLDSLKLKPSDAARAWGDLVHVQPGTLGGATTPDLVPGYICPECRPSVAQGGAPGLPTVDLALLAYLGFQLSSAGRFTRSLAPAWAALPPGTEPNRKPWGHVDTVKLSKMLDAAQYVQRVPKNAA